jgi:hypothetical protein
MLAVLYSVGMFLIDLLRSRRRLEAENLFLRPSTEHRFEASAIPRSTVWL